MQSVLIPVMYRMDFELKVGYAGCIASDSPSANGSSRGSPPCWCNPK